MSAKDYKKLYSECILCQTKFDIWLSMSNFSLEQEEVIRQNFYNHCPACRLTEQAKNIL